MFGSIISYRTRVPAYGWKFWKRFTNYAWLQMTFTNRPETHAAIYAGNLHRLETDIVFDAGASVRFDVWNFNPETHTVFQIGVDERILKQVLSSIVNDYNTKIYGISQLPYFVLRWMLGKVFDVRKMWYPFRGGIICSELIWYYLHKIAVRMKWYDLREYLDEWHPDNFHAGDVRLVLDKFTGIYFNKIKGH